MYIPGIALPILKLQDPVKLLLSLLKLIIAHLIIWNNYNITKGNQTGGKISYIGYVKF